MGKKSGFGSISLAYDFDRIKSKVVLIMNRLPKPTEQLFAMKIIKLLSEVEAEANQWASSHEIEWKGEDDE